MEMPVYVDSNAYHGGITGISNGRRRHQEELERRVFTADTENLQLTSYMNYFRIPYCVFCHPAILPFGVFIVRRYGWRFYWKYDTKGNKSCLSLYKNYIYLFIGVR